VSAGTFGWGAFPGWGSGFGRALGLRRVGLSRSSFLAFVGGRFRREPERAREMAEEAIQSTLEPRHPSHEPVLARDVPCERHRFGRGLGASSHGSVAPFSWSACLAYRMSSPWASLKYREEMFARWATMAS
jgi:hypothetical protein